MSYTVDQMAAEFVKFTGRKLPHSSVSLCYPLGHPNEYRLHGNVIATQESQFGVITFNWCGWYTTSTARHMNAILKAAGAPFRVSYSSASRNGITTFSSASNPVEEVAA